MHWFITMHTTCRTKGNSKWIVVETICSLVSLRSIDEIWMREAISAITIDDVML